MLQLFLDILRVRVTKRHRDALLEELRRERKYMHQLEHEIMTLRKLILAKRASQPGDHL